MISDYPIPFYIRFFRSLIGKQKTSVSGRLQGFSLPLALQYRLWDSSTPYTNLCALALSTYTHRRNDLRLSGIVLHTFFQEPDRKTEDICFRKAPRVFSSPSITVSFMGQQYPIHQLVRFSAESLQQPIHGAAAQTGCACIYAREIYGRFDSSLLLCSPPHVTESFYTSPSPPPGEGGNNLKRLTQ